MLRDAIEAHNGRSGDAIEAQLSRAQTTLTGTEEQIARLVEFVASGGQRLDYVAEKIRRLEITARTQKAEIEVLRCIVKKPLRKVSPREIGTTISHLRNAKPDEVEGARDRLRRWTGKVPMRFDGKQVEIEIVPAALVADVARDGTPAPIDLNELREHLKLRGWESIRANTVSRRGSNIGLWITNVRAAHRRGELEPWVVAELELVPGWSWEPRRARQEKNIAHLAAYVAAHGWDAVSDALIVDEIKMGDWISNCRMRYRDGTLPPETVSGLEAIAGWSWSGRKTWYQPKDKAGRFVDIPMSERVRQRDAKSARKASGREKSNT